MPRLLVIKGTDEGKQLELTAPRIGIGRDAQNGVRLHDTEVSRRHAEIVAEDETHLLRDLNSANGTFLNNIKITGEVELQPGDRIQIGQTILVYSSGHTDTPQEPSDLADHISMITRHDLEMSSAIIKTIGETEGSRILSQPYKVETPWLKNALANLTILYEASNAISHILDVPEMLQRVLELCFNAIGAERGCIMLRTADTEDFEPRAVFRRDKNEEDKIAVSRTIMDYVLREKQGVLLSDATQDERFSTGQSIVRYGIREVICVPMKGRHETLGVFYLDTRSTARDMVERKTGLGKFTEDHLRLAIALAHLAALAVEETRYHQALLQAERLAAIGQTIANLSHSIKNILQGLRSGSEILKIGMSDKDETLTQQGWRIVEKNQGKIYDLVKDMLSYSKEREPAIEATDLNVLATDVVELMQARAKEMHVKLELNLEAKLPTVQADPDGLHHALLNIVTNALDAVEDRKNALVAVGTRVDPEPGWLRLVVIDNGIGIPTEKMNDIFKPFVSTKGSRGTGLGLAVSRKILREHGGEIQVTSQPGKGSKFILRLPIKSPLSIDPHTTGADLPILPPPPE